MANPNLHQCDKAVFRLNPLREGLFNNYNTEKSLCRPLVPKQSTANPQSFPLNSSAMIYQLLWNQQDIWHEMEASDQIPNPHEW